MKWWINIWIPIIRSTPIYCLIVPRNKIAFEGKETWKTKEFGLGHPHRVRVIIKTSDADAYQIFLF